MALLRSERDTRGEKISHRHDMNLVYLCQLIEEGLPHPLIEEMKHIPEEEQQFRFLMRAESEQFDLQLANPVKEMARALIVFEDLSRKVKPPDGVLPIHVQLPDMFRLSVNDYLKMYGTLCVGAKDSPVMTVGDFPESEKFQNYLDMISVGVAEFRRRDSEWNVDLDETLTRFRFNPLRAYPLIRVDSPTGGLEYYAPLPSASSPFCLLVGLLAASVALRGNQQVARLYSVRGRSDAILRRRTPIFHLSQSQNRARIRVYNGAAD